MSKQDKIGSEVSNIVAIVGLVVIIFLSFFLYIVNFSTTNEVLGSSIENSEIETLQKFMAYNPDYLPGWIKLRELSQGFGYVEISEKSLEEIYRLDPNFKAN